MSRLIKVVLYFIASLKSTPQSGFNFVLFKFKHNKVLFTFNPSAIDLIPSALNPPYVKSLFSKSNDLRT